MRARARALPFALLSACAARTSSPPSVPVLAPEPTQVTPDAAPPGAPAETFAELVRQVADRERQSSIIESNCSLERIDTRLRFAGHAAPAVRPLPQPSSDLDTLLSKSVSVNVLTPYGRYGDAPGALTLATFSEVPPLPEAAVMVVTDLGVYVRGVDARVPLQNRLARDAAVQSVVLLQPAVVFVAAESNTSTTLLSELLAALDSQRVPVALAVDLPSGTALPSAARATLANCPDGLPATEAPEGQLALSQLSAGVELLRARAADCTANAEARAAAGGRLRVMLRIDASGSVSEACASADEIGDAKLQACILGEARKLRFAAPSPSGVVDLELPLALKPREFTRAPLLCDAQLDQTGR